MTENTNHTEISPEEENFEAMLNAYESGMNDDIQVGDKITGTIIAISNSTVFVSTGTKADGAVDAQELKNEDGELTCQVGDTLDLYVVSVTESEIKLSKAMSKEAGSQAIRDAHQSRIPVEGKVTGTCKGGFHVEVMKKRAFCPISQMDIKFVEKPEEYLNQTFEFLVQRYEEKGRNIVVSRKAYLDRELSQKRETFLASLATDQILEGTVSKIMPYGAFIELFPGIEGMAHVSELSWTRVDKPEEAVSEGEHVKVKVISITPVDNKPPRISLSVKQVEENPMDNLGARFKAGDVIPATITRLAPFGAFAEIAPGVEGLIHISEMSYTRRVLKAEDVLETGQKVSVCIKSVDPVQKRVGLSLRDAEGDPWAEAENRFQPGQAITGTVEKRETFGMFITLAPGITGLLHKSKTSGSPRAAEFEKLKPGDTVSVFIDQVQAEERKISLGTGEENEREDRNDWKKHMTTADSSKDFGLGTMGDLLAAAMKKQK